MLQETVAHLEGVIEALQTVNRDYERTIMGIRNAARIRVANGHANGNGTA